MAKTRSFFAHPCKYPGESNFFEKSIGTYTENRNWYPPQLVAIVPGIQKSITGNGNQNVLNRSFAPAGNIAF